MVWCDFCGSRQAILYCRADSAKLCLWCDQQVHSANALSKKHLRYRSQICDNCAAEPASFRCSTDGLVLCQDCDWDAHDRCPVDSFSGCPSALELAASWGLEIEKPYEWGGLLDDLMKNSSCGKQKQVILKQLIELLADGGGDGEEDVRPGTPRRGQYELLELAQDRGGFTSLLMMPDKFEIKELPKNKQKPDMLLLVSGHAAQSPSEKMLKERSTLAE
ncbi:hypothetical protein SASPL_107375 [Salvia splendens]|uniref:B box-type domain-containing protein n=1 Tax=Salvia splendens TaxID=180675 RepID=A0A8X9A6F5_SALSN|nr:hypothetical protein SASPL_107375 [Salvia splendens]